jgi:hypothetical protein
MRTTLTLDDDNAVRLERLRKTRDASLKEVVNEAIRRGLDALEAKGPLPRRPMPRPADLGALLFPSVKEALGAIDEEDDLGKMPRP